MDREQQAQGTVVLSKDQLRQLADKTQLAIIDGSAEISFADYRSAVARTVACMRDAGIQVVGDDAVDHTRGFPVINYSFSGSSPGRTDEETLATADTCQHEFSTLVEGTYETQPSSVEAEDAAFAAREPAIRTCLKQAGRTLPAGSTVSQIQAVLEDVLLNQGIDCDPIAPTG